MGIFEFRHFVIFLLDSANTAFFFFFFLPHSNIPVFISFRFSSDKHTGFQLFQDLIVLID